ncbi:MAG: hypothetical protein MRY72_12670, partial [Aquisalinus sp.]|nr:hypothetical protein [Aquisalinus sp.]
MSKANSIPTRVRAQYENLKSDILRHDSLYYEGKPEISDSSFDQLRQELKELERLYPDLHDLLSPELLVGAPPSTTFSKVEHGEKMLSLDN